MTNMVWAALAYGAGIYGALALVLPWQAAVALAGICLCLCLYFRKQNTASLVPLSCFLVAIAALGVLAGSCRQTAERRLEPLTGKNVVLTGRPVPDSFVKDAYGGISFVLQEERGKVRVHIRKCRQKIPFYGTVKVRGVFSGPSGFYNPGSPNPHVTAAIQGMGGRLQGEAASLTILSHELTWQESLQLWGNRLRQQWAKALPPADAALLSGMVLGGSSGLPPDVLRLFQRCGLSHLLAVSGSHMVILLGLLWAGTGILRLPNIPRALLVVGILALYTVLCGLRPSVCRAFLMGAGTVLGKAGRKKADSRAFFGLAAILLLSWKPFCLWDSGFLLSFGACLGLLWLRQPIAEKLGAFLPNPLAQALAVPLSAQAVTLPVLIHFFHMLSVAALAANLLLVPLLSFCLAGGGLGAVIGVMGADIIARSILVLVDQFLGFTLWAGTLLAHLPGTHLVIGKQTGWIIPLYYMLVLSVFQRSWFSGHRPRFVKAFSLAVASVLCLLLVIPGLFPQPLTAYFLDVGQGDCAVVVTPEKEVLVMDMGGLSGNFDTGERILVPFLRFLGVDQVDVAFVSHGHHDHAGGLAGLLKWYPVKTLCLPNEPASPDVEKALHIGLLNQSIKNVYKIQKLQRLTLKKSIIKIIEAPEPVERQEASNETSVIMQFAHPFGSLLFTGDAPAGLEQAAARYPVRSDVLKVSHHGSKTSSQPEFLKTVQPRLAVISAGRENRFGHPHEETLKKLKNLRIPVVRTDKLGAVKITFDEHGLWWYSNDNMNEKNIWK